MAEEELDEAVNDIIAQIKGNNKTVREKKEDVTIDKENLEEFIMKSSGKLVNKSLEIVDNVNDYISSAPENRDVAALAEVIKATSASIDGVSGYNSNYFESGSDAFCGSYYGTMLSGSGVPRSEVRTVGKRNTDKLEVKRSFQMPVFYTDPDTGSAGELWYNVVDNALKFTFDYNAWSEGSNMINVRRIGAGTGTTSAASRNDQIWVVCIGTQ